MSFWERTKLLPKDMVVIATGTWKSYTAVVMIYRLLKAGIAKRVLFLVDRRALAVQAAVACHFFETPSRNMFSQEYEVFIQRFQSEDFEVRDKLNARILPNSYLTQPEAAKSFVYICTIQLMALNLLGRKNSFEAISKLSKIESRKAFCKNRTTLLINTGSSGNWF